MLAADDPLPFNTKPWNASSVAGGLRVNKNDKDLVCSYQMSDIKRCSGRCLKVCEITTIGLKK